MVHILMGKHKDEASTHARERRYRGSYLGVFIKYIYEFRIFDSTANGILRGHMKPTGQ